MPPSLPNGIDHIPKGLVNGDNDASRDLNINDNNELFCKDNDLIWFLRVQLAEALNLQVHRFGCSNDFCIDKNNFSVLSLKSLEYSFHIFIGS